jgi:glycosyltransferase involved in cell wall biosynthesis
MKSVQQYNFFVGIRNLVAGRGVCELVKKAVNLWQREGAKGWLRVMGDIINAGISYREWILKYDMLSDEDRILIKEHIAQLNYKPCISVLMPVYNTPEKWLRRSIESVRNQLYPYWELCIADDASTSPHVRSVLEEAAKEDARIKVVFRSSNGHISAATNSALEKATGEFIALLDHDDELAEHALYHIAAALNEQPNLDLLYSDEDKIDSEGRRFGHYFKPDWNHDLFLAQNLISHLGVYRTQIARKIGGFREGLEGSQDWDFALRFIEQISPDKISHLPHVLYHWRSIPGSTAVSVDEKDYAKHAAKKALQEFWQRRNVQPHIEHVASGHFRTKFPLPAEPPLVSIVIVPSRNQSDRLVSCLNSVFSWTNYPNKEVLVVDSEPDHLVTADVGSLGYKQGLRVLPYEGPLDCSTIINWAVAQASGDVICLLDINVEPIAEDWLKEMINQALRSQVGVVGGITYYPTNAIYEAGCVLVNNDVGYLYSGYSKGIAGYVNRARLVQNLSIVSSTCIVVNKAIWLEVAGLDSTCLYGPSVIDFCLRVQEKGYRNVWTPFAEFQYHGTAGHNSGKATDKRKQDSAGIEYLLKKWSNLTNDPAWNPNLGLNGRYIQLASPPKVKMPWRKHAT